MDTTRFEKIKSDVNLFIIRAQLDALITSLNISERKQYQNSLKDSVIEILDKVQNNYSAEEFKLIKEAVGDGTMRKES